jgi:S1-C subfamily serine protease
MKAHDNAWSLVIASLLLFAAAIGCGLPRTLPLDATAELNGTSITATAESPTAESPVVTPVSEAFDEIEAANALDAQVIAVYEALSPSVVNITSLSYVSSRFMQPVPQEGTGSGFVYDAEGHIVTNYHVVEGAEELLITLASGQEYEAEVVGTDPATDLAVLRIDAGTNLPQPVTLTDSDQLRVGQSVLAIGNPFGLARTLTTGVVSALGRVIESSEDSFIAEAIQTDAAINPGNSGGPLLDLTGRVVGITSQIISSSGTSSGVGFAVSSNTVRSVVPQLIANGYYPHPWLGVETLDLTPTTTELFRNAGMNLPVDRGVLIIQVVSGGPAEEAGIERGSRAMRIGRYAIPLGGDVIVGVNGVPISSMQELTVYLETETTVGDTVELTIIRDGEERTISLRLAERPQA